MEFRQLTPYLTVSPQIMAEDIDAIAQAGFTNIINNRPNGEEAGQPESERLLTAASRQGLHYSYIPVTGGNITDKDIAEFRTVIEKAHGPVFAFCRSGTRSARMWALACADRHEVDEIISLAGQAGYDLTDMKPVLETRKTA